MTIKRKGQASPAVLLIAVACAGTWFAGVYVVKGVKKLGHEIAKPFHHGQPKPTAVTPKP